MNERSTIDGDSTCDNQVTMVACHTEKFFELSIGGRNGVFHLIRKCKKTRARLGPCGWIAVLTALGFVLSLVLKLIAIISPPTVYHTSALAVDRCPDLLTSSQFAPLAT